MSRTLLCTNKNGITLVIKKRHYNNNFNIMYRVIQARKQQVKDERRRRTLANATKQQRAAQWIRDNIIANQVG